MGLDRERRELEMLATLATLWKCGLNRGLCFRKECHGFGSLCVVGHVSTYRELFVLKTVEPRLGTQSFCLSLQSSVTADLYCLTPWHWCLRVSQ